MQDETVKEQLSGFYGTAEGGDAPIKVHADRAVSRFHGPDTKWWPGKTKFVRPHQGAHTYRETQEEGSNGKVIWKAQDESGATVEAYPHPANN
jgi:hypothetical protein